MDNKKKIMIIILTGLIGLIPMLMGVFLWNQLPDTISMEFATNGMFGQYSPKWFVVFGLPVIFLVMHGFCLRVLLSREDAASKLGLIGYLGYVFCPAASIICAVQTYGTTLGWF